MSTIIIIINQLFKLLFNDLSILTGLSSPSSTSAFMNNFIQSSNLIDVYYLIEKKKSFSLEIEFMGVFNYDIYLVGYGNR